MSSIQKISASVLDRLTTEEVVEKKRSSKEMREEWTKSINEVDFSMIEDLDNKMSSYVENFMLDRVEASEPRVLADDEIDQIAREYKSYKSIVDALEARKGQIRTMIFNHLNVQEEESGGGSDRPIEYRPGSVKTEQGITFKREGGSMKDPTIDTEKLVEVLGEKSEELFSEVIIPEQKKKVFNEEVFMQKVESGEISLEQVRSVLKNNGYNSPRFVVR